MRRTALITLVATWAAAVLTVARPVAAQPSGPGSPGGDRIGQDAAWVEQAVRPDGAIATNPDQRLVWPYLANYAASGLARAASLGDSVAARTAWGWLSWYAAHQDGNGYVTDFQARDGVLVSTGTEDSTDAYAGTFLVAARDMMAATADTGALRRLQPGILRAVRAIESTQDVDGLTWAKPGWHVKYLMDQSEAYGGLEAATQLAPLLGDDGLRSRASSDAERMRAGVEALWNPATGAYDWAVGSGGGRTVTRWTVLYPDAMQQAWAVAYGLVGEPRAKVVMAELQAAQPQWDVPTATALSASGPGPVGYWAVPGWALRRVGADVSEPLASVRGAALAAGRAWPFTTGVAGELMVLEAPSLFLPPPAGTAAPSTPPPRPAGQRSRASSGRSPWWRVLGRLTRVRVPALLV